MRSFRTYYRGFRSRASSYYRAKRDRFKIYRAHNNGKVKGIGIGILLVIVLLVLGVGTDLFKNVVAGLKKVGFEPKGGVSV